MKQRKLIGDKAFYKMVLAIAVPIMVQNGITNFINLLDNIMVGRMGTEPMSGVSIINQLLFVFNLCIFGGFSGPGIFAAQFYGKKDIDGVRRSMRYKIGLGLVVTTTAILVLSLFGKQLISLYLNEGSEGDLALTLEYGLKYIKIMFFGLPAYALVQAYASTLRECGETVVPMRAGLIAVFVNLVFNWLLIYGNLGFPRMGVEGAAIATVLSRYVELSIVIVYASRNKAKFPFVDGLYDSLSVGKDLFKSIFVVGSPLLLNEALWSIAMAVLNQCYSFRGLDSVAGFNISSTLVNVFKVIFLAFGSSVGIIVGQLLGAGKMEEAVDTDRKIIAFSVVFSVFVGMIMASASLFFPNIYNTTETAKLIASQAILVASLFMPLDAFKNATYYTLRSGGRTFITFFYDGCGTWLISVPIAYLLSRLTNIPSVQIYFCVYCGDFIRAFFGFMMVKKRIWLRNIVSTN